MPLGVVPCCVEASMVMLPTEGGIMPKGEAGAACISVEPDCVAAIRRGSFDAGSGTMRGSCGEMGVWNSAGQTR